MNELFVNELFQSITVLLGIFLIIGIPTLTLFTAFKT